jgi:hypothetical protein
MVKLDTTRNHLRQQRLKNDVVLPINKRDFSLLQLTLREHFAQMNGDVDSAKSAAKNENTLLCHSNLVAPEQRILTRCRVAAKLMVES